MLGGRGARPRAGRPVSRARDLRLSLVDAMKVLIVDDEKPIRELLARILCGAGHQVVRARSAVEARAYVRVDRPDLIFLDVGMPGINGHQLARSLGNDPETFDQWLRRLHREAV